MKRKHSAVVSVDIDKDRDVVKGGEWNYYVAFVDLAGAYREWLVRAEGVSEIASVVIPMMQKSEKVAVVAYRAGLNVGGPIDALLKSDGTIGVVRGKTFKDSLFWSLEEDPETGKFVFEYGQCESAKAA